MTLNNGQIENLWHEMLDDKVAEVYPNIASHYALYNNNNQLLHDTYNGKFPRTIASVIDFELKFDKEIVITKEVVVT